MTLILAHSAAWVELQYMRFRVSKLEYVVMTHRFDANTLL